MFKNFPGYQLVETYHNWKKSQKRDNKTVSRAIRLIIAIVAAIVVWCLPVEEWIVGMTIIQKRTLAIFLFAILMWLFEAVPAWTTSVMLPTWVENGVNVMFPIEIGVWGDQFEAARKKFGHRLLGVGGMDKTALRKDRAAVDVEIERLKRLASMGGFIPCPDHRLMPGTKFELVQYYIDKIKSITL